MPKGRRFVSRKSNGAAGAILDQEIHYCVVCYNPFYQFNSAAPKWESSISKVFYKALNIPPISTGVGDEDDEEAILSLPYCPECHTKISVMYSLYSQLELIQNQYATLRNEIAFIVVETIEKNCKNGPMDFIRHQIYEKWKEYHAEESAREDYRESVGLDALMTGNITGMSDINFQEEELGVIKLEDIDFSQFENRKHNLDAVQTLISRSDSASAADEEDESWNGVLEEEMRESRLDNDGDQDPSDRFSASRSLPLSNMEAGIHSQGLEQKFDTTRISSEFLTSSVRTSPSSGRARTRGGNRGRRGGQFNERMSRHRQVDATDNNGVHETLENVEDTGNNQLVWPTPKRGRGFTKRGKGSTARSRQSARNIKSPKQEIHAPESEPMEMEALVPIVKQELREPAVPVDGLYQCKLCPKSFTDKSRLVGHESSCHPSLRSLRCHLCGRGFSSKITYHRHMNKPQGCTGIRGGPYPCTLCKKIFKKPTTLVIHKKTHHKERPKVSPLKKGPLRPRKNFDGILNGGDKDKHSITFESNEEGVLSRTSSEKFSCRICNKGFQYQQLLNMHILTHAKKNRTETAQLNKAEGDFVNEDDNRINRTLSSPGTESFIGNDSDNSQFQTQQRASVTHNNVDGMSESL